MKTVFVGLSGGVDSSVAALRLKKQGYNVVGVFIKVWHPDFMVWSWEQERLDAMRVAAHLEIPFLTCDAEATYKQEVADYFIAEYQAGRTPNPDVMCNKAVKFGAFLRFAQAHGADYIATGHYVQKIDGQLHKSVDATKDQSYFLWTLTTEQLEQALFPIGDTTKQSIRCEAEAAGIPVATKKDSQGICFLGHVDIADFLSHYIELAPGDVLSTSGEVIGSHQGAFIYTLGQRHGFTIDSKGVEKTPHYVVSKNVEDNTITVSTDFEAEKREGDMVLRDIVLRQFLQEGEMLTAHFRYHGPDITCKVTKVDKQSLVLLPALPTHLPAKGQSVVLYKGTHCIGGGIVT